MGAPPASLQASTYYNRASGAFGITSGGTKQSTAQQVQVKHSPRSNHDIYSISTGMNSIPHSNYGGLDDIH